MAASGTDNPTANAFKAGTGAAVIIGVWILFVVFHTYSFMDVTGGLAKRVHSAVGEDGYVQEIDDLLDGYSSYRYKPVKNNADAEVEGEYRFLDYIGGELFTVTEYAENGKKRIVGITSGDNTRYYSVR